MELLKQLDYGPDSVAQLEMSGARPKTVFVAALWRLAQMSLADASAWRPGSGA